MKLARKFTFVCERDGEGYLYTAEQDDDASFIVTWEWNEPTKLDPYATYTAEVMANNIINGVFIVREVIIGPEAPKMKYEGKAIRTNCNTYRMKASDKGDRYILVGLTGESIDKEYDFGYTDERIDGYVSNNSWSFVEESPVSLESSDDVVADNYGFTSTGDLTGVTDWTLIDSGEKVEDYGVLLADVQRFTREFPAYYVSVGPDFYGVHLEANDEVWYVAKDEAELATIFQAIRTLDRFVDRG
jgi:hypothetical protein